MGGIGFSLVGGGDIHTLSCSQKFTRTPPRGGGGGQRCIPRIWRAVEWANSHSAELPLGVQSLPSAMIGHVVDMDLEIQPGLRFGLGRCTGPQWDLVWNHPVLPA